MAQTRNALRIHIFSVISPTFSGDLRVCNNQTTHGWLEEGENRIAQPALEKPASVDHGTRNTNAPTLSPLILLRRKQQKRSPSAPKDLAGLLPRVPKTENNQTQIVVLKPSATTVLRQINICFLTMNYVQMMPS